MSAHTPGPWTCRQRDDVEPGGIIRDRDNHEVARTTPANARLIAAAPEMAALLHQIGYEPWGAAESTNSDIIRLIVHDVRALLARIAGEE